MRFSAPLDGRKVIKKVKKRFLFISYTKTVSEWRILAPFRFYFDDSNPHRFVLVSGGPTLEDGAWDSDLASVPGVLGFVMQKDGIWSQAAVAHDWSYKNRGDVVFIELPDGSIVKDKPLTRKEQDEMFKDAMEVLGTNLPVRFLAWRAVRRFGWIRYPKST